MQAGLAILELRRIDGKVELVRTLHNWACSDFDTSKRIRPSANADMVELSLCVVQQRMAEIIHKIAKSHNVILLGHSAADLPTLRCALDDHEATAVVDSSGFTITGTMLVPDFCVGRLVFVDTAEFGRLAFDLAGPISLQNLCTHFNIDSGTPRASNVLIR